MVYGKNVPRQQIPLRSQKACHDADSAGLGEWRDYANHGTRAHGLPLRRRICRGRRPASREARPLYVRRGIFPNAVPACEPAHSVHAAGRNQGEPFNRSGFLCRRRKVPVSRQEHRSELHRRGTRENAPSDFAKAREGRTARKKQAHAFRRASLESRTCHGGVDRGLQGFYDNARRFGISFRSRREICENAGERNRNDGSRGARKPAGDGRSRRRLHCPRRRRQDGFELFRQRSALPRNRQFSMSRSHGNRAPDRREPFRQGRLRIVHHADGLRQIFNRQGRKRKARARRNHPENRDGGTDFARIRQGKTAPRGIRNFRRFRKASRRRGSKAFFNCAQLDFRSGEDFSERTGKTRPQPGRSEIRRAKDRRAGEREVRNRRGESPGERPQANPFPRIFVCDPKRKSGHGRLGNQIGRRAFPAFRRWRRPRFRQKP